LLLLHCGPRQLEIVVRRMIDAVAEIERERGADPSDLVAAVHAADGHRVEAGPMWLTLSRAWERGRTGPDSVIVVA
jgi:hypothetical protein